jgi:hypothetical protein
VKFLPGKFVTSLEQLKDHPIRELWLEKLEDQIALFQDEKQKNPAGSSAGQASSSTEHMAKKIEKVWFPFMILAFYCCYWVCYLALSD